MTSRFYGSILRVFCLIIVLLALALATRVSAQLNSCTRALPTQMSVGKNLGRVAVVDGNPLNVRARPALNATVVGQLPEGAIFDVLDGPTCADGIYWYQIKAAAITGWAAESANGKYYMEPGSVIQPFRPTPTPLPIPATYGGSLPALPVKLDKVLFLKESNLNAAQTALIAQNGFVVVPGGLPLFDAPYNAENPPKYPPDGNLMDGTSIAQPNFITTDAMLDSLHYIFDNLLTDVEKVNFQSLMQKTVSASLQAAQTQAKAAAGTPIETAAQNAVVYLAVAEQLFAVDPVDQKLDPALAQQVQPLVQLVNAASGVETLAFLGSYKEDFSAYRPRGHYAGDPVLEHYFRGMVWLSHITFLVKDDAATQTAVLLTWALQNGVDSFANWQTVHDLLDYLIGPVDDLGPVEYGALVKDNFGADMKALADPAKLKAFKDAVANLPGPRINGLVNPGTTQDVSDQTRGFRFLGQRFTLDGLILQQLMYPYVGSDTNKRLLPLALDVASAMGSAVAYDLTKQAGATQYENYDTQMKALRAQVDSLTIEQWQQNTYSAWLWTLQPLLKRDAKTYPPLMQTRAWLLKDISTALASYTELKHDTVLYAKQPDAFGGGGAPLYSYGYVEPNPQVFERLSLVANATYDGLMTRLYPTYDSAGLIEAPTLSTDLAELGKFARQSASFALMAQKELAGQPLTDEDYYAIQFFGQSINERLRILNPSKDPLKPVALVTDIASNPSAGMVLQEGVGGLDYIYVVIPGPKGLQLARGAILSYYEFVGPVNSRLTDEEWRQRYSEGKLPPRPDWVKAYLSGPEVVPPPSR